MQTVLSEGGSSRPIPRQALSRVAVDGRADPPAAQPSPFERVLSGMVGAGLVQEAICAFLTLTLESLSGHVARLGLPMPSDRPMRKPCGRQPWTVADIRTLISLWCANLPACVIARMLGRSPGGVRSKGRRLGLYRRNRRDLIKARDYLLATCGTASAASPEAVLGAVSEGQSSAEPMREEATSKATRRAPPRIAWNAELDRKLAARWWAGQHHTGIARDLGMTEGAVRSRANALGLPPRGRKTVPDYIEGRPYDRTLEESRIKRWCIQGNMDFWTTRNGPRTSPKIMKTKGYKKARSGPEEYHAHI